MVCEIRTFCLGRKVFQKLQRGCSNVTPTLPTHDIKSITIIALIWHHGWYNSGVVSEEVGEEEEEEEEVEEGVGGTWRKAPSVPPVSASTATVFSRVWRVAHARKMKINIPWFSWHPSLADEKKNKFKADCLIDWGNWHLVSLMCVMTKGEAEWWSDKKPSKNVPS